MIGSAQHLKYSYDAAGNRIKKEITIPQQNANKKSAVEADFFSDRLCSKAIRIYPNPTSGMLKIEICGYENSDNGYLYVYNLAGQHIITVDITSSFTQLDISDKPKGIYILQIEINGETSIWKIIKE